MPPRRRIARDLTNAEGKLMGPEAVGDFVQLLARFDPPWVLLILAVAILCYRAPEIVRAFRSKR
jgi:hypothetical protein